MLSTAWALAAKDLRIYFRDRMGLVSSLLVPIAMVTVFGWIMAYAFGGAGGMPKVTLWIVDLDNSPRSEQFTKTLRASSMLDCKPAADAKPLERAKLEQMVADGDAHHGVVIPQGYGSSGDNQTLPELEMIRDPGRQMEDRILQIALMQALLSSNDSGLWKQSLGRWVKSEGATVDQLSRFNQVYDGVDRLINSGMQDLRFPKAEASTSPQDTVDDSAKSKAAVGMQDMLAVLDKIVPITNTDIIPPARPKRVTFQQAQSVSGISVMMLMFSLTNAGALLLAEREKGTLRRLLALPMQRESVLLGKFLYVAVVGCIQMAVLMIYGEFMFKVGLFRDPVTLLVLVITWVATAGAFGMAIATLCTSAKQGDGLANVMILVMAALGGCWFPVQMMSLPLPLEIASKSTLTYWAMEGFQGLLWNGLSFYDSKMLRAIGIQWLWTLALSAISVYGFRRNYLA